MKLERIRGGGGGGVLEVGENKGGGVLEVRENKWERYLKLERIRGRAVGDY